MFVNFHRLFGRLSEIIGSTTEVRKQNVIFTTSYTCDVLSSIKHIFLIIDRYV